MPGGTTFRFKGYYLNSTYVMSRQAESYILTTDPGKQIKSSSIYMYNYLPKLEGK